MILFLVLGDQGCRFGDWVVGRCHCLAYALDLSEDLRVLEEEVFLEWVEHLRNSIIGYMRGDPTYLLAHFDGIASPARQQYTVTSFDSGGDDLAVFVGRSWAYGNDGSFR